MPLAVILVEDSPLFRKSLISGLAEFADVQVIATAETADQGVAALKAHVDTWRLAVVDMFLKGGNGLQVLRAGRVRRRDQRMVVLTNYATSDIRRKSTECGADAVFDKSTEIDQFLELCRRYAAEEAHQEPGIPKPHDEASIDLPKVSGVEELIERVAVDRLLTDAVIGSAVRNAAAVREHLARQGSGRGASEASATMGPQPNDSINSTPTNERDDEND